MLKVDQVMFRYGASAFHFNFEIRTGDIIALVGESGVGKSSLLNLIAGFLQPQSGRIYAFGKDITKLKPHQRGVTMLFQDHNLFQHLSVYDNVALGLEPSLKLNAQQNKAIEEVLKELEIDTLTHRLPPNISGGEAQRVALARCLIQNKPIMLLDEPFGSLDPALRSKLMALVHQKAKQRGITTLMATHFPGEVHSLVNAMLKIDQGVASFTSPSSP